MSDDYNKDLSDLVEETIRTLYDKGIAMADLTPLVKLHDAVKSREGVLNQAQAPAVTPPAQQQAPVAPESRVGWAADTDNPESYGRDERRGEVKASEELMARASAIIDVLVQSGHSTEHAAQLITRQLLSVGIQLPDSGGDARAWKRLDNWRNTLIHYKRSGPAWDAYCAFKEQLAHISPDKRLQVAVGERLWDQRKQHFSSQNIA